MNEQQLNDLLRPMLLPDLRTECRSRGLNPGGGREALLDRVRQDMLASGNYILTGRPGTEVHQSAALGNNYSRPEGQNVGNFLTDRNSSRVLNPPGGKSQISFGGDEDMPPVRTKVTTDSSSQGDSFSADENFQVNGTPLTSPTKHFNITEDANTGAISVDNSPKIAAHTKSNNYHRSEGQNVGNFMTDRNSSRVIAPPGGHSNITFG